jgi:O-antigen ligase
MLQLYHMTLMRTIRQNFDSHASRATNFLLYLLITLIPFSVRHVFETSWNFKTGAYSDFTSLSIYMSDFVLIALILIFHVNFIFSLPKLEKKFILPRIWIYFAVASVIWLVIELLVQNRTTLPLQIYFSFRIICLIVLAGLVSQIRVSREKIGWLFTVLGAIQSIIAIIQFYTQQSIGLYSLGESHLSPDAFGIAKIVSHGTKLIRGYGTFPHPNLLAAFLVVSLFFNLYLLTKTYQKPRGGIIYATLALNIYGLFLTFSRGGILAFGVGFALFTLLLLTNKDFVTVNRLVLPVVVIIAISIAILAPYLSTRTTITDSSTKERLFYDEIGEKQISAQPFLGLGPGTSVLHMKQFSSQDLESWDIQPIHNYYLIAWSEWGLGAILLLMLILIPIVGLFMPNLLSLDRKQIIAGAIGVSILVLFIFDHYFYTIWPTQLLLWLLIGLFLEDSFMWNKPTQISTYDTLSQK